MDGTLPPSKGKMSQFETIAVNRSGARRHQDLKSTTRRACVRQPLLSPITQAQRRSLLEYGGERLADRSLKVGPRINVVVSGP